MEVLSGPWIDLAFFLRQTVTMTNKNTDTFLPVWLFGLLLFLSVCLLLLQIIIFLSWKLRHAEAELSGFQQNRSDTYRQSDGNTHLKRRSFGSRSFT